LNKVASGNENGRAGIRIQTNAHKPKKKTKPGKTIGALRKKGNPKKEGWWKSNRVKHPSCGKRGGGQQRRKETVRKKIMGGKGPGRSKRYVREREMLKTGGGKRTSTLRECRQETKIQVNVVIVEENKLTGDDEGILNTIRR